MWCIAELNEEYIARMEDVLKIYEKPLSERGPVVCMDEKPVVLHADVRPPRPMRPGRIARRDCQWGTGLIDHAQEAKPFLMTMLLLAKTEDLAIGRVEGRK